MEGTNINTIDAINSINKVNVKRLTLLIERILTGMIQLKHSQSQFFNQIELQQLVAILKAQSSSEVKLVINFIVYTIDRLAFLRSPSEVVGFLRKGGMEQEKIQCIMTMWKTKSDKLFSILKKQDSCQNKVLDSFSWQLGVPLGYSKVQKSQIYIPNSDKAETDELEKLCIQKDITAPEIQFIFNVDEQDNGNKIKTHTFNMKKQAAQDFFQQLELIQLKLDELTN